MSIRQVWNLLAIFILTFILATTLLYLANPRKSDLSDKNSRDYFFSRIETQQLTPDILVLEISKKIHFEQSAVSAERAARHWINTFSANINLPHTVRPILLETLAVKTDVGVALAAVSSGRVEILVSSPDQLPILLSKALESGANEVKLVTSKVSKKAKTAAEDAARNNAKAQVEADAAAFAARWGWILKPCETGFGVLYGSGGGGGSGRASGGLTAKHSLSSDLEILPISRYVKPLHALVIAEVQDSRPVRVPAILPIKTVEISGKFEQRYCRTDA